MIFKQKLKESVELLEKFKNGSLPPNVTNKELWEAQKIKQSTLHPDTNEKIFMPFRMSGYVPFNAPVVAGLLIPNPTIAQTIFWQWLNQSHNACVNYANRNVSKVKTYIFIAFIYSDNSIYLFVSTLFFRFISLRRYQNLHKAMQLQLQQLLQFLLV